MLLLNSLQEKAYKLSLKIIVLCENEYSYI
jgi:hypothetical protein